MKITELSVYKGDTFKLVLDNDPEQTFFVNAAVVNDFSLRKGQELCGSTLSEIKSADTLRKAKRRALYLLGEKQFARKELEQKLKLTYGAETAKKAVDYMCELGYINDEEYAPKLAEYLIHSKRYGMRKARYEMLRRGLEENLVDDVLAEIGEDEIDEEIMSLLERKYYAKICDFDDRRRTIAALARRGYDYRAVKRCIERLLDDYEEDEEDFD